MKNKNKGRDSFITKMRSPNERVFSKTNHRTRYRGVAKNQFAMFMESLAFNLKRMVILNEEYGFYGRGIVCFLLILREIDKKWEDSRVYWGV
jgi:hypothetical protein